MNALPAAVLVYRSGQPRRNCLPALSNTKGELCDQAIQSIEASNVFTVVQRSARLGQALVRKTVLKLLHLILLVEIILLDLGIFVLWIL